MRRHVTIALATFVVVFFFAMSLTLTLAESAKADICCISCAPSCEQFYDGHYLNGICTRVTSGTCYYPLLCRCP